MIHRYVPRLETTFLFDLRVFASSVGYSGHRQMICRNIFHVRLGIHRVRMRI